MAWNRSSEQQKPQGRQAKRAGRPFVLGGLIVFALVAILGAIAFWLIGVQRPGQAGQSGEKPRMIREVKPAPAPVALPQTNAEKKVRKRIEPEFDENGKWIKPANWDQMSLHDRTLATPVGREVKRKPEKSIFSCSTDKMIYRLLQVKPGVMLFGTMRYTDKFVSDFLDSLKEPIVDGPEDTEEDRLAKQAVREARQELKAAHDRGEDIAEIMRSTEDEVHKMAAYRLNLDMQFKKFLQDRTVTDQDIRDFAEAANMMLDEKGLEHLRMPVFYMIREKMQQGEMK